MYILVSMIGRLDNIEFEFQLLKNCHKVNSYRIIIIQSVELVFLNKFDKHTRIGILIVHGAQNSNGLSKNLLNFCFHKYTFIYVYFQYSWL